MPSPSYREIAKLANVSLAAVSYALRNRPEVSPETRARIQAVARQAGYKPNPLVTALMAQHRKRKRRRRHRAIIAYLVEAADEEELRRWSTLRDCFEGVRFACEEAGFLLERLHWGDFGNSPRRLFAALHTRRAPGVVFQGADVPAWCLEGWDSYALASAGNRRLNLPCHFAVSDHYMDTLTCINKLVALGYKRIGFAMERAAPIDRDNHRWLSAYMGWMTQMKGHAPLAFWTDRWDHDAFVKWLERKKPDVIVAAQHVPLESLRAAGRRIPEDIGFVHLGLDQSWHDIAGVRQNNFEVGQAAAHLVIDQINRNIYGVPAHQRSVFVAGDWFEGPTVRSR